VTLLDRLARLGDQEVAKVATVPAPAELSYVRSQLLGYQRQALAEMRSLSSGLKAAGDDRAKMAEISRARLPRIARIVRESQPKLQSLGLASCAARTSA